MYFFWEHLSQSHRKSKIGHAPWGLFINKWLVSIYNTVAANSEENHRSPWNTECGRPVDRDL